MKPNQNFLYRSDGEALLPEVHGRVHSEVFAASSHRRRLFWHRLPSHALHGPPGVPAKETSQPVRSQALRIQDPSPCLSGSQILKFLKVAFELHELKYLKAVFTQKRYGDF